MLFRETPCAYRVAPACDAAVPPKARRMAERHLALWRDPEARRGELQRMRASNAEWDFMGRTFFVLSLLEMAAAQPSEASEFLQVADLVIDETLRLEREHGFTFFTMDYARPEAYVRQPPRSLFVDGEIALMLVCRNPVATREELLPPMDERIAIVEDSIENHGPWVESYPNEGWLFDHMIALAALRVRDAIGGTDHDATIAEWLAAARERLIHRDTGLLASSFTEEGEAMDGPEGSTIFLAVHCLRILDPSFALDQYERARRELAVTVAGFGYAREWPESWKGPMDIDSGPIVPIVGASAGASGLALLAAASFDDREYLAALHASLGLAAFPVRRDGTLRYCASNLVGDAVLLYSMTTGPLWRRVGERLGRSDFATVPRSETASEAGI